MAAKQPEGVTSEGTANTSRAAEAIPPGRTSSGHPPLEGEGTLRLANRFVLTANIDAKDGGREIAYGNGKVVRARLSDAVHFWKTDQSDLPDLANLKASAEKFGLDLKKPLDQRMARLDHLGVTFHAKLGTQGERVERIARLAEELAPVVGADPALARRAAVLAKADLQTEVVGEFPELQGAMGRKYAALQGEDAAVATAIEEHYKPQGPSDVVPVDPVAMAVALADKLDTLVGFWAIDEKPTGSKDPYALRRAALGVIRILIENGVSVSVGSLVAYWMDGWRRFPDDVAKQALVGDRTWKYVGVQEEGKRTVVFRLPAGVEEWENLTAIRALRRDELLFRLVAVGRGIDKYEPFWRDLLSFFHDRLKVYLRDKGARHDLIDAVITPEADDLLLVVSRVAALGIFLDTEDGKNLLAGTKRAANILAAEEKKGTRVAEAVDPALLSEPAEQALSSAVNLAEAEAGQAIALQDFEGAMRALATLRAPVDTFFEAVLVNAEDEAVRANRLALLARIRAATGQVADFSRIAG